MTPTTSPGFFVSLSEREQEVLSKAGSTADPSVRRQAVTIALSKSGEDATQARSLLAAGYLATTEPSFHLIPRGDAMASEDAFAGAYEDLATATDGFSDVSAPTLEACLTGHPAALAPLRMIVGFTHNELAVAMRLVDPDCTTTGSSLKTFERKPIPERPRPARAAMIHTTVAAILAVMAGEVLSVPEDAASSFHSKIDKRDTRNGWTSVASDAATGVPYHALLYQRYVGGSWRQVQDAYSEVKGDRLLEVPLAELFTREGIPFYQAATGASGATRTAEMFGLSPGPDFLLPNDSPTVIVEAKIGEDGGTVRDKASRIKNLALAAHNRGLVACAVIDGKGWRERPSALIDVVLATEGRTYSLSTLSHLLSVPEIVSLRNP